MFNTTPKKAQGGVALFVSLIFLLLLTIVGVSAMKSATLQEKMSGNTRFKTITFQYAEAGLREGEGFIANLNSAAALAACAQCNGNGCRTPDFDNAAAQNGNSACGIWRAATDGNSLYQIQKLGTSSAAINVDPGESVMLYRVTSVATVGNTTTALESIYAKN
ncbi:pilus assembly PilX family protein [Halopseudomonas salina]|uniref:Pilus assembly protein PilX n=1 Tax=Halopseudomonas salina TaxID=1323744 RepID=A0ABQ1PVW8_9GAMM|nr:PilX N-terminal domain-containing pilus assembly protein [Halopseudomonas salina]GGD04965.1 pilus assembly protein PilX [Halopseudomonas salina]